MRVFLVHGMGRTPASMVWLALRLRLAGHRPTLFGYAVTLERLASISQRFTERVRVTLGHGTGGPGYADSIAIDAEHLGHFTVKVTLRTC